MTDVRVGGRRRVDRVLAPDYLDGLAELPVRQVRARRAEAEGEEVALSALARLVTDRLEVVTAERHRRGTGPQPRVDECRHDAGPAYGSGAEHAVPTGGSAAGPPRWARARWNRPGDDGGRSAGRRRVERLVADVDLSDVAARTDDELARVWRTFRAEEQHVSEVRARVREVIDRCGVELAARYRAGQATAADLVDFDGDPPPEAGNGR